MWVGKGFERVARGRAVRTGTGESFHQRGHETHCLWGPRTGGRDNNSCRGVAAEGAEGQARGRNVGV